MMISYIYRPKNRMTDLAKALKPAAPHLGLKEGYYLVHEELGVWSTCRKRFLSNKPRAAGYSSGQFLLADGVRSRSLLIHVIVMETFHGKTPSGMVVDHINRCKSDNRLCNLRFVTYSDNSRNKSPEATNRGYQRPVNQYSLDGQFIREWDSATTVYNELGYYQTYISLCCRKLKWSYKNYCWEFNEPDLPGETWKPLLGIHLSNLGRVKSPTGRVSYGSQTESGYRYVTCDRSRYSVHELVCRAYHGEPNDPDMVPNHINRDKGDNRPENLEWLSNADNIRYSCCKAVIQTTLEG